MIKEEYEFLFAITSINVTFYLMKYFHLPKFLDFKIDKEDLGSRKALKNFCVIITSMETAFDEFHEFLLKDIFNVWTQLKKDNPTYNIM